MARVDKSGDWARRFAPTDDEIRSLAQECYARLPTRIRELCGNLVIATADFADDQLIEDLALDSEFELLGLFEGGNSDDRSIYNSCHNSNRLTLFRRPILDYWADNHEPLSDIITHVLVYEIGQYFNFSEDELDALDRTS